MPICISHGTALRYLLRVPDTRRPGLRPSRARAVSEAAPQDDEAQRLLWALGSSLPVGTDRIDVLVGSEAARHQTETVRSHLCTENLPAGSFILTDAFGIEFYLSSPELVFLQMAGELEMDHLVYVGFALCSRFMLSDIEPGGCALRERPLTTTERIRGYLDRLPSGTRNCAKARRALEHVRDGARSPKEGAIAMLIGMPLRYGGRALGTTEMNQEMRFYDGEDFRGNSRWVTRIPDIVVTAKDDKGIERRVGVDYDPTITHGDPSEVSSDIDRRNLIAPKGGFTHITLGNPQVDNYVAFCRQMDRIRRCLKQRRKPCLREGRDSARGRRREAEAMARQFELWNRLVGSERFVL